MNNTTILFKDVPILSFKTLIEVKQALEANQEQIVISTDLGITNQTITLNPINFSFQISKSKDEIPFPKSFREDKKICYAIMEGKIFPLKMFNEESNFYYKLVPTSWRPILRISATPMHKKLFLDAIEKFQLKGFILDSGTGLGYSAIIASKTATQVFTIEWDESVLELASFNPHSKDIFQSSNIDLRLGDITEEILAFEDNYFDAIIQDGGMPKSSGDFFSQNQCKQLHRVLKKGGDLYFYLPQHDKSKGRDWGAEHIERLKKAGFYVRHRDIEGSYVHLYKSV
jgi:hypothetical protein